MKINLATNKNIIIKLGFSILIILILAMVVYTNFILKDIRQISGKIYNARVELEKKYLVNVFLKKNINQLNEILPRLQDIDDSFIKYENNLEFINDLENEAEKLGIQLNISLPEIELIDTITTGVIQLTITGEPNRILKYLNVLDKKNYYLNFSTIKILNNQSSSHPNDQNYATLILDGKIYWE